LLDLYPAQAANLTAHRASSLAALAQHEGATSVNAGIAWGQTVADAIWAWRLADGNAPPPPPFAGVLGIEDTPQRSAPGVPAATELAGRWSAIRINDTMGPHPAFTLPPSSSTSMEQRYDEAVEVGQATIEVYPKYPSTCAALAGVWLATCRRCDPPRQYGDCVADYTKRTSFRNIFSSRLLGLTLRLVARARVLFLLDQFELPTPTSWPC